MAGPLSVRGTSPGGRPRRILGESPSTSLRRKRAGSAPVPDVQHQPCLQRPTEAGEAAAGQGWLLLGQGESASTSRRTTPSRVLASVRVRRHAAIASACWERHDEMSAPVPLSRTAWMVGRLAPVRRPPDERAARCLAARIPHVRRPETGPMTTVRVAPERVPDAALCAALDLQVSGRAEVVGRRSIRAHLVRVGNKIREQNAVHPDTDRQNLAQPSSGPGRTRTFV